MTSNGRTRRFDLKKLKKSSVVIGRATKCDLRVALPSVDDCHCEIIFRDDQLELVDLNSTSGTFYNGQRIEPGSRAVLKGEDRVSIGPATFLVEIK